MPKTSNIIIGCLDVDAAIVIIGQITITNSVLNALRTGNPTNGLKQKDRNPLRKAFQKEIPFLRDSYPFLRPFLRDSYPFLKAFLKGFLSFF